MRDFGKGINTVLNGNTFLDQGHDAISKNYNMYTLIRRCIADLSYCVQKYQKSLLG